MGEKGREHGRAWESMGEHALDLDEPCHRNRRRAPAARLAVDVDAGAALAVVLDEGARRAHRLDRWL